MKPKEKEFCRLMTVYADPIRAAREAGYKHPEKSWAELASEDEIVSEIRRLCSNMRSIYENAAVCGLYRLAYGGVSDALTLIYREDLSDRELSALDLTNVSEIKKTDKGIEVKFCDRIKAIGALSQISGTQTTEGEGSGLLDAIRMSARALGDRNRMDQDGF